MTSESKPLQALPSKSPQAVADFIVAIMQREGLTPWFGMHEEIVTFLTQRETPENPVLTFTLRSVEGHEVWLAFPDLKSGDEALMLHEILQSLVTGVREAVRTHAGDAADKANIGGDYKPAAEREGRA